MSKIVIADSSCLIALSKIGELRLLEQLFSQIFIPQAVHKEVVIRGEGRPGSKEVLSARWIKVHNISDRLAVNALRLQLGIGESEAIVLENIKQTIEAAAKLLASTASSSLALK